MKVSVYACTCPKCGYRAVTHSRNQPPGCTCSLFSKTGCGGVLGPWTYIADVNVNGANDTDTDTIASVILAIGGNPVLESQPMPEVKLAPDAITSHDIDAMRDVMRDVPDDQALVIDYTNYLGERRVRTIKPTGDLTYRTSQYHPELTWLLEAYDPEKDDIRTFDLTKIHHIARTGQDMEDTPDIKARDYFAAESKRNADVAKIKHEANLKLQAELSEAIHTRDAEIVRLQRELDTRQATISDQVRILAVRNDRIRYLKGELDGRQGDADHDKVYDKVLNERDREIETLKQVKAARDRQIETLKAAEAKAEQDGTLQRQLAEALKQDCETKDVYIKELEQDIISKNEAIMADYRLLIEHQSARAGLADIVESQSTEIGKLQAGLKKLANEANAFELEADQLRAEKHSDREEINYLKRELENTHLSLGPITEHIKRQDRLLQQSATLLEAAATMVEAAQ